MILKPAAPDAVVRLAFAECVHAAQVPKGVFQLVLGAADPIAQEFLENPAVPQNHVHRLHRGGPGSHPRRGDR